MTTPSDWLGEHTDDRPRAVRESPVARLPTALRRDPLPVRIGMLQRLACSRQFALGDRSGVLKSAQARSGRAFRLDVRQRVIVKALVSRHQGRGSARAAALMAHLTYLTRPTAGLSGARAEPFDASDDPVAARERLALWAGDRHHFRFIISPEHGDRLDDLPAYVRAVMSRVSQDLGGPALTWIGVCHHDTDQPHAHVLVRGRRADGRDLVIPRDYMGYGFRARAQEVAQERLGDLSRLAAERRIWRETQADRFTGLDRRMIAAADHDGLVAVEPGRTDAWAALSRGRLLHLERLGLARPSGSGHWLAPDLESRLRGLQLRGDIIRTLNQRRLEHDGPVVWLRDGRLAGTVVRSGFHDELGASPYALIRDAAGTDHYARLAPGSSLRAGQSVDLTLGPGGLATPVRVRGTAQER